MDFGAIRNASVPAARLPGAARRRRLTSDVLS